MDRLVSTPSRDSICPQRGRKPPSSATEVSIPDRDSKADKALLLLPSELHDTG